jgi:hypothetical protein
MSKNLEDFVKDNLDAFNVYEPGPMVWNSIRQQLIKSTPAKKKSIPVIMKAIIILLGAGRFSCKKDRSHPK